MRNVLLRFPLVLLAVALGCASSASLGSSSALSTSAGSVSDSVSASSDGLSASSASIADSSESDPEPAAGDSVFRDDVREYTAAYLRAGGEVELYRTTLAVLAAREGISDWESDPATYVAIGEGLGRASATQLQVDAFKRGICGDPARRNNIQLGYDAARR